MGLALSKRLIEAQGGHLGMDNAVGIGCTFWIDLAVAAPPEPNSAAAILDVLAEPFFIEEAWGDSENNGQPATADETPQTVLYIEDNEPNRRLVELLLSQRPHTHLITASCGCEGLELARAQRPDLILLDMHLPDIPGEQVLEAIRRDERTRDTQVIVVSADATERRIRALLAAGAVDYLTKPIDLTRMIAALGEHLPHKAEIPS